MSAEVNPVSKSAKPGTSHPLRSPMVETKRISGSKSKSASKSSGEIPKLRSTYKIYPRKKKTANSGYGSGCGSDQNSGGPGGGSSTSNLRRLSVLDREEAINYRAFSPLCYLKSLAISCLIFMILSSILVYSLTLQEKQTRVVRDAAYGLQTNRRHVSIASDNLDCSIYIKLTQMQGLAALESIMLGMMCLHVTEPHSVAPDSIFTGLHFVRQKEHESVEVGHKKIFGETVDPSTCHPENPENFICLARQYLNIENGYVNFYGDLVESEYQNSFAEDATQSYSKRYSALFKQFSPQGDRGLHIYEDAFFTENYNETAYSKAEFIAASEQGRIFPISRLSARMAKKYNASARTLKFLGYRSPIKPGGVIKVGVRTTRYLMDKFFHYRRGRNRMHPGAVLVSLRTNKTADERGMYDGKILMFPKGPTSSVLSAFVVKVVHGVLSNSSEGPVTIEKKMYGLVLIVQRLAYQLLPNCKEWTGYGKKSLMDETERVIEILAETKWEEMDSKLKILPGTVKKPVTRKKFDRVSSLILWTRTEKSSVITFSMGLPQPFESTHYTQGRTSEIGRFSVGSDSSRPFTSASTLYLLVREVRTEVTHAVTSSGSLRNVESTALAMLRMLLLDEEPGKAVSTPAVFYDPRDYKYYCETQKHMPHNEDFYSQALKVKKALREIFNIECNRIRKKDFIARDRSAFAMSLDLDENADILGAIDPRHSNKNIYVTGL